MSCIDLLNRKKADIDVFYKEIGNLKLPLQVFLPGGFGNAKKYKTIIAIHGGGWNSLKETPVDWDGAWMANNAKYYAEKGYVGIVFSYRDVELDETTDVGDVLSDCYDAIEYIKKNFSFVDDEDTMFMGDSAGGHIALCLGMGLPHGRISAIKPKNIAAYNPVTDCMCDEWKFCADEPQQYSPLHNIKNVDAKILIMHGTKDSVVSIDDSRLFTDRMKYAGNDISMVEVQDANHAFILFGFRAKEEDVLKALKCTDEYFNI